MAKTNKAAETETIDPAADYLVRLKRSVKRGPVIFSPRDRVTMKGKLLAEVVGEGAVQDYAKKV